MTQTITLRLTPADVQLILTALGQRPYAEVAELLPRLHGAAVAQMNAHDAAGAHMNGRAPEEPASGHVA